MKNIIALILLITMTVTLASCAQHMGNQNDVQTDVTGDSSAVDNTGDTPAKTDVPEQFPEDDKEETIGIGGEEDYLLFCHFVLPTEVIIFSLLPRMGISQEEFDDFTVNVLEPTVHHEKQSLPYIYRTLSHFDISKEQLIKANNEEIAFNKEIGYEGNTLEDWMINALYCGDENRMKKELLSPYSLYSEVDNDVYNIYELQDMDAQTLYDLGFGADELTAYFDRVKSRMGEQRWNDERYSYREGGFYELEREAEIVREMEAERNRQDGD